MPTQVSYPGVYIEEVSSGVRTITSVATSITAFLGRAIRGPVNVATTITSYADFERTFGGLKYDCPMSYAVRDFFLNGGGQAVIVRLFHPSFADEAARQAALVTATTEATTAANAVKTAADNAANAPGATPQTVKDAVSAAIPAAGNAAIAAARALDAVAATAAAAPGATATTVKDAVAAEVQNSITRAANSVAPRTRALIKKNGLKLGAAYEGSWGNALRIRIDHDVSADVAQRLGVAVSDLFNLTVREYPAGEVEQFRNVTVIASARKIDNVLKNESRLLRATAVPAARPNKHDAPAAGADPFDGDPPQPTFSWVSEAASDGTELDANDYQGSAEKKTGLYALDLVDLFNLLCIPADVRGGDTPQAVYSDALKYCRDRRALLIVDSHSSWDEQAGQAKLTNNPRDQLNGPVEGKIKLTGERARNAALFFPRIRQADPERDGQIDTFVPCGMIAGIMASTDAERGVWKAPAGIDAALNGVHSLTVKLTDKQNGILNPVGINCLRSFPASGNVVWGARTLRGDDQIGDEYKYIPVRRTALFIEESLYRGTQWAVFEPNDEPLWAQLRLNIGAFMHDLFRQGAFQGRTPRDAYFVKCDKETTTQNDINRGIVNVVVGFAPLKPAEFVIIKLTQIAGQIEA